MRASDQNSIWCLALAKGCSKVNSTKILALIKNILWKNPKGQGNKLDWNWLYRTSTMWKQETNENYLRCITFLFHYRKIQVTKVANVYSSWTFPNIYSKRFFPWVLSLDTNDISTCKNKEKNFFSGKLQHLEEYNAVFSLQYKPKLYFTVGI